MLYNKNKSDWTRIWVERKKLPIVLKTYIQSFLYSFVLFHNWWHSIRIEERKWWRNEIMDTLNSTVNGNTELWSKERIKAHSTTIDAEYAPRHVYVPRCRPALERSLRVFGWLHLSASAGLNALLYISDSSAFSSLNSSFHSSLAFSEELEHCLQNTKQDKTTRQKSPNKKGVEKTRAVHAVHKHTLYKCTQYTVESGKYFIFSHSVLGVKIQQCYHLPRQQRRATQSESENRPCIFHWCASCALHIHCRIVIACEMLFFT